MHLRSYITFDTNIDHQNMTKHRFLRIFETLCLSCDVTFKNDQSDKHRLKCFLTILKTFCYYGMRHNIATLKYQIILP